MPLFQVSFYPLYCSNNWKKSSTGDALQRLKSFFYGQFGCCLSTAKQVKESIMEHGGLLSLLSVEWVLFIVLDWGCPCCFRDEHELRKEQLSLGLIYEMMWYIAITWVQTLITPLSWQELYKKVCLSLFMQSIRLDIFLFKSVGSFPCSIKNI